MIFLSSQKSTRLEKEKQCFIIFFWLLMFTSTKFQFDLSFVFYFFLVVSLRYQRIDFVFICNFFCHGGVDSLEYIPLLSSGIPTFFMGDYLKLEEEKRTIILFICQWKIMDFNFELVWKNLTLFDMCIILLASSSVKNDHKY